MWCVGACRSRTRTTKLQSPSRRCLELSDLRTLVRVSRLSYAASIDVSSTRYLSSILSVTDEDAASLPLPRASHRRSSAGRHVTMNAARPGN